MVNGLSIYREPALHIIHHDTYACGTTNLTTEVGLSALAKLAFFAFCLVTRNDMIPRLHLSYSFADTFHNSINANRKKFVHHSPTMSYFMYETKANIYAYYPAASWPRMQGNRPSGSCIANGSINIDLAL
jgi:hypothetical protein